jgi:(1->4)-alpha-D-glucan 1-alpha-D-glucosylmutase
MSDSSDPPRATYRLQFHKGFRFRDAAALAPYLADLGISHVYASPFLKARPSSTHGYDIVDHGQLNPELGDVDDFHAMVDAFRQYGLSQVLDFVPNHMGVGGSDNLWWLDTLEWGEDSEYAGWFDIDWDPDQRYLSGKLLVPFLGDQYGAVLESGQLRLRFDPTGGDFAIWAYDVHKLPVCPLHYALILGDAHPELEQLGDAFSGLPNWRPRVPQRARDLKAELSRLVRERDDAREAVEAVVARVNGEPDDLQSWRELDALIKLQHWRAAHFRVAADDINYRRFFNINDLAGLRMELPELFEHAHRLVFQLLRDGVLGGLRIDHVDGLLDPKGYLLRLRERAPRPFYLWVEKILAQHESLPAEWQVSGTTGYEFTNLVLGLLVNPAGEEAFTRCYIDFTGGTDSFATIVRDCKIRIMRNEMASELNVLARDGARIARQNPYTADFTRNIIQRALQEVVACFPVYRTYIDGNAAPSEADRRNIDYAIAQARRNETDVDPSVFDYLHKLLTADLVAAPRSGFSRHAVVRFAMRVQQYSGPVMAKGLEDTAFYRYNRFVALNEVGGSPDQFGVSLASFHRTNDQRAAQFPHTMLGTSTHDTKRGEDARARLAVLSEMPEEWQRQVTTWSRILRGPRGHPDGTTAPDRNDEYLFYQLLVGTWPAELTGTEALDPDALRQYVERMEGAMRKSMREAKVHSTWAAPDEAYEAGTLEFVRDTLDTTRSDEFMAAFLPFQERVARLGLSNTLVQTTLKMTLPGLPDIYQGAEVWDLSLMDPDNRRPVDYDLRQRALAKVTRALERDRAGALAAMRRSWQDGQLKLAVTATLLAHRRAHPRLFAEGSYQGLKADGLPAEHVCAYSREAGEDAVVVIAARFPAMLEADPDRRNIVLPMPASLAGIQDWRDLLSGRVFERRIAVESVLSVLPVAVLVPR